MGMSPSAVIEGIPCSHLQTAITRPECITACPPLRHEVRVAGCHNPTSTAEPGQALPGTLRGAGLSRRRALIEHCISARGHAISATVRCNVMATDLTTSASTEGILPRRPIASLVPSSPSQDRAARRAGARLNVRASNTRLVIITYRIHVESSPIEFTSNASACKQCVRPYVTQ